MPRSTIASAVDAAALAALHRVFAAESVALERRHGLSDAPGASLQPAQPSGGLARVMQRLVRGQQVVLHVVGGSAAAGAGGVGVNHTFDARLVTAFNRVLEQAEEAGARRLGRLRRSNVAQGGTSSFWAGLLGEALHGTRPSLVLWEYAINDHSVALDAVQRLGGQLAAEAASAAAARTMRYMLDFWLRRVTSLRAPPALLLGYLWDKQPSAPFKPGNRALCRKMPVPGTAFEVQSEVTRHYLAQGADVSALSAAAYVSHARRGAFCPLIADGYYHPSAAGHQLVSELLLLVLTLTLTLTQTLNLTLTLTLTLNLTRCSPGRLHPSSPPRPRPPRSPPPPRQAAPGTRSAPARGVIQRTLAPQSASVSRCVGQISPLWCARRPACLGRAGPEG